MFSGFFLVLFVDSQQSILVRNMNKNFWGLFILMLIVSACTTDKQRRHSGGEHMTAEEIALAMEHYNVEEYFPGRQKDTLLTNMVTYIYRRPADATVETRTDPRYRSFYVRSAERFEYVYHEMDDSGTHYYYLIRPARNLERTFRGVGGRFTTNENLELVTFEEIFNTTIMDLPSLREKGLLLFEEMLHEGNVDRFIADQNLVEWPDHRLKYNKERREWRYVD